MKRQVLWLGALLAAAAAAGAIMIPLDTADLVNQATLVVAGTVEKVTTTPPDGAGMIYTEARVRVSDTVLGATNEDVITVRVMGGVYGDLGCVVEDEPTFNVGEEVVLFLAPAPGGGYKCPGGFQGVQKVVDGTVLPVGVTLNDFLAEIAKAAGR